MTRDEDQLQKLDATLGRILAEIRSRVDPDYVPTYDCPGGCEDTGWIEIDDGIRDHKAPTVRRCTASDHRKPKK